MEGLDYELIPRPLWLSLIEVFGVVDGQSPIERTVIETGMFAKHCVVSSGSVIDYVWKYYRVKTVS